VDTIVHNYIEKWGPGLLAPTKYVRILLGQEPERRTSLFSLHLLSQIGTSSEGFHLVLLQFRWRSKTDAILKCRTDMYTVVVGMRLPNVDDKTWHDNKWHGIVEQ
jgi:hypothetical protein